MIYIFFSFLFFRFADFPKWRGKKVLEIGCGLGTESINFVRNGAELTIVELSGKSLELTKQRFKVFGLSANFIQGNAEELDSLLPPNQKFDLIWSFGVIHHTPHPEKIIAQMRKVIQPETGEIRLMLYSRYFTLFFPVISVFSPLFLFFSHYFCFFLFSFPRYFCFSLFFLSFFPLSSVSLYFSPCLFPFFFGFFLIAMFLKTPVTYKQTL